MKTTAVKGRYVPKNKEKTPKGSYVYRSLWERRFMLFCDKSPNVLAWENEPFSIPYIFEDKHRNYWPDFYIKYIDTNDQIVEKIVEIKPRWQGKWPINKAKWMEAEQWCHDRGYQFQVMGEEQLF